MGAVSRRLRQWPVWAGYAASSWSLAYGALGLYWAVGGAGFPFGAESDPGASLSVLAGARRHVASPVIAALGLIGAVAGIALARTRSHGMTRLALLAFAWGMAVSLALVIPDFRVLVLVAYAPIIILGAPFGWPPRVNYLAVPVWPILNQGTCVVCGLLWALTAVAYQRRSRDACIHCGRGDTTARWTTPSAANQWGTRAVYVAVAIPVVYALTRWAWALGFPLGITEKFYREGLATGLWWRGAALGTLAIGGAVLTLGLVRRWGEVFPRWIPIIGGAPVPLMLVVVPATFVAVVVTSAGLMFVRKASTGTFMLGDNPVTVRENWAALWPELFWPVWGVALAAAALAYYYRTRPACRYCGRR